ncbi:MAG: DUF2341 domain-containing protein, partial [Candidatus Shapirobacteria bacterium]|nr:DUF2341 domain-containing protein [Candidatus Shapirobacteria bacterium]
MPRKSLHSSINNLSYKSLLIILFFLLISIVVLWKFVLPNHKVEASWWNDGWNYRKAISISNTSGSNLTDFQISLSIGTSALIASGKMQSDCDDIRITDINGNLLPYWIDPDLSCNTTSDTIIYVKFSSIISGDNTAYLYYGNSSATIFQNGNDVFPQLFDTFDSTTINSRKFSYGGGTITQNNFVSMVNDADAWDTYFYDNSTYTRNSSMVFQSKFKADSGARVMVGLHDSGTGAHYNNLVYAFYFNNGSFSIYEDGTSRGSVGSYTVGNWYNIKIELKDIGAKYYYKAVNSTTWILLYDSSYSSESNLKLGVSHYDVTEYSYTDDWIIRKYASIEPTSTLQSEEAGGGPIAYWKFDEGSDTTAYDSTTNQNNGTISGATWQTEDQCISGKCLYFNGDTTQRVISDDNVLIDGDQTFSVWFYPTQFSGLDGIFTTHNHSTTSNIGINLDDNKITVSIGYTDDTREYNTKRSNFTVPLNKWTHAILVFKQNENTISLFVNGKFDSSWTLSKTVKFTSDKILAGQWSTTYTSSYRFYGLIDEPKIYRYARTAAQIKLDYNSRGSSKGTSANLGGATSDNNLSEGLVG